LINPLATAEEEKVMRKSVTVLRNSLISLALAAALPMAAGAADPPAKVATPVQSSATPPSPKVLDIKPPDIHQVMSAQQIAAAIPNTDESEFEAQEVSVRGEVPAPYVPGGFAALYWAATHPTDSWRILTPVQ
jgi:hypothetical protein